MNKSTIRYLSNKGEIKTKYVEHRDDYEEKVKKLI